MNILAARSFRVLLAVTLAANCCLPCYTLAYADESQEVADVSQEEQKEVPDDASGLELSPGVGEPVADATDGEAAAEGHGADDGAAEGAGEDTSADNGGLGGPIVYNVEPDLDYPIVEEGTGGNDDSFGGFAGDNYGDFAVDYGISAHALPESPTWTLANVAVSGVTSNSYTIGGVTTRANVGTIYWAVIYCWSYLSQIKLNLDSANNYLKAIDTATKGVTDKLQTRKTFSGESAATIKTIPEILYLLDNKSAQIVTRLNTIISNDTATNTLISNGFDDVFGRLQTRKTFAGESESSVKSAAEILYLSDNRLAQLVTRANTIISNDTATNTLISNGFDDVFGRLQTRKTFAGESEPTIKSAAEIFYLSDNRLAQLVNRAESVTNTTDDIFGRLQTRKTFAGESVASVKSVAEILYLSDNRLSQIVPRIDEIRLFTSRHVLNVPDKYEPYTLWDLLYSQLANLENVQQLLIGLQQTLTAWGNRWDAQDLYLMEWAKRWDALDKSPADLSETNKLLGRLTGDVASIRDKYVVGDSLSDMFGALVGDLQVPATSAAIDGIKGAMSTAFPFCIPSVVNLVLFGSVVADPQAPCWEFDIVGCPLVVDFAGFEDFAEVCRWTVRLLFAAALLLNTRKFVYGVGGAY